MGGSPLVAPLKSGIWVTNHVSWKKITEYEKKITEYSKKSRNIPDFG